MPKTKVLHLIKSLGRGGAEKLIPQTAKVHNQSALDFHCLYFYHQKENIVEELETAGVQVHLIPSGNLGLFFQVKKVCDFVQEGKFDLIHAHLPWAGILARLVGKRIKIPIVYTEHNTWERYNKLSYWGNRLTFKSQDIAIAVSYEVALSMRLNSIWDPYRRGKRLKIKVIQNGVNTDVFVNRKSETISEPEVSDCSSPEAFSMELEKRGVALKAFLSIPTDSPVIGKVAVFRSQKRLWLWIETAIRILVKHPDVHFLLVGDGEWRAKLEKQIQDSGWKSHFHLVGVQKDVLPYLSIMDIYLSSSEFEGLPIAMLEAMSCEIPVVSTRAGGIGEVIQHGKQGYLCGVDDWEELEKYCVQLLSEPGKLRKMGKASRRQVVENFSMKKMVADLEAIYFSV